MLTHIVLFRSHPSSSRRPLGTRQAQWRCEHSLFSVFFFFHCLTRVLLRLSVENVPGLVLVRVRGVVQLHRVDAVVLVPEPVLGPHGRGAAPGAATGSRPMRLRAP